MFNFNFYQASQLKSENQDEALFNKTWESKYDVSLSILKEDYFYSLKALNDVDEKANRYLIIVSIALTSFFIVTSSSATDGLLFSCCEAKIFLILSVSFILFFIATIFYGFIVFKESLRCFNLVNIEKIPNIKKSLDDTSDHTILEYKDHLITAYQLSINSLEKTIVQKQSFINKISKNINYFILFTFLSILTLITLKIIR